MQRAGNGWRARDADAAPYNRNLHPVTQGKKFDPEGLYVRRWIPEIAGWTMISFTSPDRVPRRSDAMQA